MATAIPKGSESTIAPILTSNVPNNKGINPNIGAGVEVGYHFVPPKNSPNVIFSSGSTFPWNPFSSKLHGYARLLW